MAGWRTSSLTARRWKYVRWQPLSIQFRRSRNCAHVCRRSSVACVECQCDRGRDMTESLHQIEPWPELPYGAWRDTCETLQLWTQIVGKVRLVRTPWLNHSWHVALYVTARGFDDFANSRWRALLPDRFRFSRSCPGHRHKRRCTAAVAFEPQSVAAFYRRRDGGAGDLGIEVTIDDMPNEIADAVRFRDDQQHVSYDAAAAQRFWRVLAQTDRVFGQFRTALPRQVQSGAFLLGQLRSRGDAIFRPPRAAASGRHSRTFRTMSRAKPIRTR